MVDVCFSPAIGHPADLFSSRHLVWKAYERFDQPHPRPPGASTGHLEVPLTLTPSKYSSLLLRPRCLRLIFGRIQSTPNR